MAKCQDRYGRAFGVSRAHGTRVRAGVFTTAAARVWLSSADGSADGATYPLPIWKALQVRNALRQHAVLNPSDRFDIETRVAESRILGKGLEVDLHTSFTVCSQLVWESTVTFRSAPSVKRSRICRSVRLSPDSALMCGCGDRCTRNPPFDCIQAAPIP